MPENSVIDRNFLDNPMFITGVQAGRAIPRIFQSDVVAEVTLRITSAECNSCDPALLRQLGDQVGPGFCELILQVFDG